MRHSAFVIMRHATERLLYGDLLRSYGFRAECLCSVSDARNALNDVLPDVVLIDLDDAHNDDFEFIRHVRRANRLVSVIGFTAWPHGVASSSPSGCDVCIQIPVSMAEVISTVRGSLKSRAVEFLASA